MLMTRAELATHDMSCVQVKSAHKTPKLGALLPPLEGSLTQPPPLPLLQRQQSQKLPHRGPATALNPCKICRSTAQALMRVLLLHP